MAPALIPRRRYHIRTHLQKQFTGCIWDRDGLRFALGGTRALALNAIDAVKIDGRWVPVGELVVDAGGVAA